MTRERTRPIGANLTNARTTQCAQGLLVLGLICAPVSAWGQAPAEAPEAPPDQTNPSPATAHPGGSSEGGSAVAPQLVPEQLPAPAQTTAASSPASAAPPQDESVDELVIDAVRIKRAPGSVHVLGREQLERFQYTDPQATLQQVPGVYVRQEDGFGLRPNIGIRGAISDRSKKIVLMEDGVLLGPAPYSAPAAYYFPLMSRVGRVEVVKGPAAVRFGPQTVGGAINLETRGFAPAAAGGAPQGELSLAGGQYGFADAHGFYTGGGGRDLFLVEGEHLRTDGFQELPGGGDTGFYRNEWMVKARHHLGDLQAPEDELQSLTLKFVYSDEKSHATYLGLSEADFDANPLRRYGASRYDVMKNHRTSVSLQHFLHLSEGLDLTTTAYRNDFQRVWSKDNSFNGASLFDVLLAPESADNAPYYALLSGGAESASPEQLLNIGPNGRTFVSQGVSSRFDWLGQTASIKHHGQAGVRLHYDRIDRLHTQQDYTLSGGEPSPANDSTEITTDNFADTWALAVHVQNELQLGRWSATPGARLEWLTSRYRDRLADSPMVTRDVAALLGGLGLHYGITQDLGVLAGVYRGFSPPAPGSPEGTDPEFSINSEFGLRFASGPRRAEIIGYYNDYQNMTDVCTQSSGCVENNLDLQFDAGRALIYGFEAMVEDRIPVAGLFIPFSFVYTHTRTEFLETFESEDPIFGEVEVGDELPYVPRHQARATVGIESARMGANAAANYVSRMRERSGSGPLDLTLATEAQFTLDLGLHYDLGEQLRVFAQGRNVTNTLVIASRRPYGARPTPPRMLEVGLKLSL